MYLLSALHGHGTSSAPSPSGMPTECTHGTNSPSSPSTSSAAWPMRVMIRMETATYGESVSSTPMWAIGEPSGPIENGTTYIVRPSMQPSKRPLSVSRISAGSRQLLVGPGVVLVLGADERAVLDARDVARVGEREVASSGAWRRRALEGARVDELLAEAVVLLRRAVAPVDIGRAW